MKTEPMSLRVASINVDKDRVKMLVESLESGDIDKIISSGVAPVVPVKKEGKEEEKERGTENKVKEEVTEEEAAEGLKTLFE